MFLAVSSFFSLMLILGNILVAFSCFTKQNVFFIACISLVFGLLVFLKKLNHTKFSYYSLSLLIITIFIYSNYSPISLGGQDPGVYVSFAGTLSNRGTFYDFNHNIKIDKKTRDSLFKETDKNEPSYDGILRDSRTGSLNADFLISPGIYLAECFFFFSRDHSFFINTIFCILAIFAFYYFCLEIFDKRTSIILTILLCFCPAQINFGKAPYSEIPAQFFIFSSLLSLAYLKKDSPNKKIVLNFKSFLYMLLTCLFLSSASLYRPELFVFTYIIIFCMPFLKKTLDKNERNILIFFQILIILFFALVYFLDLKTGSAYISRVAHQEAFYVSHAFAYCLFAFICSLGLYVKKVRVFLVRAHSLICKNLNKELFLCLFTLGVILFLAGVFVYRIMFCGLHQHYLPEAGRVVETMNEMIFHRVAVLTGVPFLIVSFFGIYLLIKDKVASFSIYMLLFLFGAYASRLFIIQSNSPQLYWAVRRYLPCVIPAIIIFGGYAICSVNFFKKTITNFVFAIGLYLISLLPMLYLSIPLIFHSEMKGALKFTETIEKSFDKKTSAFIGDAEDKHILQQLKFLGGYDVYLIPSLLKDNKLNEEKTTSLKNLSNKLKEKNIETFFIFLNNPMDEGVFEKKLEFDFNYKRIGEDMINFPQTIYDIKKNVIIGNTKN